MSSFILLLQQTVQNINKFIVSHRTAQNCVWLQIRFVQTLNEVTVKYFLSIS
jgi:hypothetical protein